MGAWGPGAPSSPGHGLSRAQDRGPLSSVGHPPGALSRRQEAWPRTPLHSGSPETMSWSADGEPEAQGQDLPQPSLRLWGSHGCAVTTL